jgi:SWI/SNF-related matrix-associated actin-dependent regulator 1 of chromatin subfamily A
MTNPYPFQSAGVDLLEKFGYRALLADEMGLGKSIQALLAMRRAAARPCVIVCPAGLKYHWEAEAALHCNLRAEVLNGTRPPKQRLARPHPLVIINYDILGPWMKFLKRLDPVMVLLDEVHYAKNRAAGRTKNVQYLCRGVPHVIGISGTPLTNRPAELWPILNILWPKKFQSFTEYGYRYCKPSYEFGQIKFKGATRLPELHNKLKKYGMVRRLKKDVLKDLPPKQRVVLPMPIENSREYIKAENDFIAWLRENFDGRRAVRAAHAQRLVQFGYLKRLAAKLKMAAVYDWLDSFLEESDEKIIVFGIHRSIIGGLFERYAGKSVLVHGGVTGRDRQRAYKQFQKSPRTRMLFGNDAAGVGWNGSCATATAHVELPWTPGQVAQAGDRMHRIGQTKQTVEYFLVARKTVESRLCEILQTKAGILGETLDGDAGAAGLNIFDMLTKSFLRDT